MKLQPYVDRLKAKGLVRVYGALELAGLAKSPAQLPAHFVVPEAENAQANRHQGIHHQEVAVGLGVVTLVQSAGLNDARVSEQLDELTAKVIDALAGWVPPGASKACDYAGGRLLTLSAGGTTLAWMTSFRTGWTIRKASE